MHLYDRTIAACPVDMLMARSCPDFFLLFKVQFLLVTMLLWGTYKLFSVHTGNNYCITLELPRQLSAKHKNFCYWALSELPCFSKGSENTWLSRAFMPSMENLGVSTLEHIQTPLSTSVPKLAAVPKAPDGLCELTTWHVSRYHPRCSTRWHAGQPLNTMNPPGCYSHMELMGTFKWMAAPQKKLSCPCHLSLLYLGCC